MLLGLVFGGTQVLLAQHSQGRRYAATVVQKSQGVAQGHDAVTSDEERKHWSAEPGCFEQKRDIPDRTVSRSWTMLSPDGRYKAYAVNEAIAERSNEEISGCKSTTKLFVSGPGSESTKAVLTIEPAQYVTGNSIELVDWSPRGHLLLFSEGMWVWASDAGGVAVHIYDADSGDMSEEDSFEDAFLQRLGANCVGNFDPIGFSASGKVVVKAFPDVDEDGILQKDSCVKNAGVWALDIATGRVDRLRDDYKVRRYGKKRN
ncbi:MAG TPA: hypothetical protein VGJ06_04820 [Candidatus Acidoferrum sp.]